MTVTTISTIEQYIHDLLNVNQFDDYCPNGLQIQGVTEVKLIVGGVTASQALIDQAIELGADAILVHHGYFWKGEDSRIIGMKYQRVKRLINAGISLLAYHLPLDAHESLGNNAGLARALGFSDEGGFGARAGIDIARLGRLDKAVSGEQLAVNIASALGRTPLFISAHERPVERVGWCTGAAESYIEQAASLGLDAYISGEVSEHTFHAARELGIHYYAAGHHATERFGVQDLGQHLAEKFNLDFNFLDSDNPV